MKKIVELIKKGGVVAFCGAGMSAESGIHTFRGEDGLWQKYDPNIYVTASGISDLFLNHPQKLKEFIVECYQIMLDAKPNQAHCGLAELESKGYLEGIITQNIDDLHYQAGSKNIAEVHGNAYEFNCPECGFLVKKTKNQWQDFIARLKEVKEDEKIKEVMLEFLGNCPKGCGCMMQSSVVLFGQSLPEEEIKKSYGYLDRAKLVLCIGTSGLVYPAASFPPYAKEKGATIATINPENSSLDGICDFIYRKTAVDFFENLSLHF